MFDFEVQKSDEDRIATLKTDTGITYRIRFINGRHKAFEFLDDELIEIERYNHPPELKIV